jgi:uncharacterized membrane protein
LGELLRGAGVDVADPEVSRALEISLTSISGTSQLPPPILLEKWEVLYPGITAKFVEWIDRQSKHRQRLENQAEERSQLRQDRSQWIAGGIAITGLILAAVVGVFGNPWVAGVIAVVGVGGPTAAVALASKGR